MHASAIAPPLHVVEEDYERLSDLVCAAPRETEGLALLWTELLRAAIVPPADAPDDLVRMDTLVRFTEIGTGEQRTVRLVYPQSAPLEADEVAITSILGAALIGLQRGAVFAWSSSEEGPRLIRINAVEPLRASRLARTARRSGGGSPSPERSARPPVCMIDQTLAESFPASDAPSWTLGWRGTAS